ncbi:hypothetical protein JZ751_013332 [Albula glossodonta]|uniref:TLC domain-containing protein n=1 Tax=Albula glossodonta TaxID=121402 RepID=A0A8T2NUW8_9TELE|nr:hypothetical protein JZ751_013332 [Albula glossodonta]
MSEQPPSGSQRFDSARILSFLPQGQVLTRGAGGEAEVKLRWFFEVLSYPRTDRLVVANGVAMAVVFFLVRIAVMPPYYLRVASTFGTPAFERLGLGAQVAWITSCICLDVLNTVWMYKIARGCYKVLTGAGRKPRGDKLNHHTDSHSNNHRD